MSRIVYSAMVLLVFAPYLARAQMSSCLPLFAGPKITQFASQLYDPKQVYDRTKFEPNTEEFIRQERIPDLKQKAEQNGGSTDVYYKKRQNGDKYLYLGAHHSLTGGERVHPDSRAVFVFLGGQGGSFSYVNSVMRVVSAINSRSVSRKSIHGKIRPFLDDNGRLQPIRQKKDPNNPDEKIQIYADPIFKNEKGEEVYAVDPKTGEPLIYFEATAEALELPGRAGSKDLWELPHYMDAVKYFEPYFLELKQSAGDRPVFIVGRSSSGMMAINLQQLINERAGREIISASVAISPMYPSRETLVFNKYSTYLGDRELIRKHGADYINEEIYKFAFESHGQMEDMGLRQRLHDPKDSAKFMIMTTQLDGEVINWERVKYEEIGSSSPRRRYVNFFGKSDHDILQTEDKVLRAQAFYEFYRFLRPIVDERFQ